MGGELHLAVSGGLGELPVGHPPPSCCVKSGFHWCASVGCGYWGCDCWHGCGVVMVCIALTQPVSPVIFYCVCSVCSIPYELFCADGGVTSPKNGCSLLVAATYVSVTSIAFWLPSRSHSDLDLLPSFLLQAILACS